MINCRLLIAGLLAVLVACCASRTSRTYQLTGQILVVKPETNEVLVKHEDIPGFMPAMTMPYAVNDPALLKDRAAGDLITATLVVGRSARILSTITKTGSAPLPEDARTTIPAAAGVHILQARRQGSRHAVDRSGRQAGLAKGFSRLGAGGELHLYALSAAAVLPADRSPVRRSAELAAGDPALAGKVRLLSISFDPAFDRAEVLRAHASKVGADPAVWRFATAEEAIVDRLAAEFGINVIREKDGTITHNLRTAVIDPSGRVVSIVDNNAWTATSSRAPSGMPLAAAR